MPQTSCYWGTAPEPRIAAGKQRLLGLPLSHSVPGRYTHGRLLFVKSLHARTYTFCQVPTRTHVYFLSSPYTHARILFVKSLHARTYTFRQATFKGAKASVDVVCWLLYVRKAGESRHRPWVCRSRGERLNHKANEAVKRLRLDHTVIQYSLGACL